MRKTLKRIGIGILTAAVVVSNMPVGVVSVKAETAEAGQTIQGASEAIYEDMYHKTKAAAASPSNASAVENEGTGNTGSTGTSENTGIGTKIEQGTEKAELNEQSNPLLFASDDFKVKSDGSVTFSLKGREIAEGKYGVQISATGNSRGYQILVNKKAAAFVLREPVEEEETADCASEYSILLEGNESITVRPLNGFWTEYEEIEKSKIKSKNQADSEGADTNMEEKDDERLNGEIISVELFDMDEEDSSLDDELDEQERQEEITLLGAEWFPTAGEQEETVLHKKQWIDFLILARDGFVEDEYLVTAQITGERTAYQLKVNGKDAGTLAVWEENDAEKTDIEETRLAVCEKSLKLKPGDIVTVYAADDKDGFVEELCFASAEFGLNMVLLNAGVQETGEYVYEAEEYFRSDGVQWDGDVAFCDMQPGETITVPVSEKSLPEGNYYLSVRSNGNRIAYSVYVDGIPAGIIRRNGTEWGAADLTEDALEDVIHLTGNEKISIKAPANKNGSDGFSYYGKVDAILLTPTEESAETPEVLDEIVLHSEDWYFGDTDGSGGVNLRPQDCIELFILGKDGFSEEETAYQMKIKTGGFHREYTVSVNGSKIGSFVHAGESGDWEPCGTGEETLENVLKLKVGDVLTIYAAEGYGVVGDITLVRQEEQTPADFEGIDTETGICVSAPSGVVPEESVLSVRIPDKEEVKAICEKNGMDETKASFYEIRLFDASGKEMKALNGMVTVEIPIPDSYQVNAVKFCQITETGEYKELEGTIETGTETGNSYVVLQTDSLGMFGILDTRVQQDAEGTYLYEAETYYENSQGIWQDGGVTFCDMQPGEMIVIPVSDQNLPEGNYTLSLSSNGTRTGYVFYINGVPAGVIQRNASGWNAADLTEDRYQGVLHLKPGDEISIEAPKNKWEDDGMLFGKLDWVALKATEEEPEISEVLEKVVLRSEDWYFGKPDDAGGVNLRPQDQIEYLIRREDGFDETAHAYQMTVRAGGFRTQYTVQVNGETIGELNRANTEWGELTDSSFNQIVTLKAGDILTIYAAENWGTVADVTLEMIKEQEPYEAVDEKSGVKISAEPGVVPEQTVLKVEEPNAELVEKACQSYGFDSSKGIFYQISLKDGEENPAELLGQVKLTLPIPEAYNPNTIKIYRIAEDGSLVQLLSEIENGSVSVMTQKLGIFGILDEAGDMWTLEAEDFYENKDGIQADGNVKFCDMQPGETVDFVTPESMEEGYYRLIVSSNGTRTAYTIFVNGKMQGVVKRAESGWNAADLTKDAYKGVLKLRANDVVTLKATENLNEGDGQSFGKLDSITLMSTSEPETMQPLDKITLYASEWYGGTQDSSGGMNVRPKDGIDFVVRKEDGFTEDDYMIVLRAGGFRKNYTVLVNGKTVMELPIRNCEWGEYLSGTARQSIHLVPGDVVTLYEAESWGCVDSITFYRGIAPTGNSMEERIGGRKKTVKSGESSGPKASGTEPVFLYQGEGYYQIQSDNPAADLQPGEQIEIVLSDNAEFVDGLYRVTVVSCGTRDHMFVKVNGLKTGRIDRTPNGYGMDQMTADSLSTLVTLHKGDLLCIEAAPQNWGWVDYIKLELVQKSEQTIPTKRYEYQAMKYYDKKQAENDVADLQPGEKIVIPVDNENFEEGDYLVSVTSCGGRNTMSVEVNGEQIGWIQRNSNNYGVRSLVRDTMPVPVHLKRGDVVTIGAPRDGGWAWVDKIDLIKTAE